MDGHLQQNWRDSKRQRLEDCLNGFIMGLVKIAVHKKDYMLRKQQEEQERREAQKKWYEEKRRAEEEKQKFDPLMRDVENWHNSRLIREYIAMVEEMASSGKYTFNFEGGLDKGLKWAKAQADRLDPLFPLPPPSTTSKEDPGGGEPSKTPL